MADLSHLSNEQLLALRDRFDNTQAQPPHAVLATLSNEQLLALRDAKKPQGFAENFEDIAKSAGTGLVDGTLALANLGGDIKNGADWISEKITGQKLPPVPMPIPYIPGVGRAEMRAAVEQTFGKLHEPQTVAGDYARTAGEFVPGALLALPEKAAMTLPTMLGALTKYALAPAVVSETAGQMTEGTALEPWARAGGALAGGGISAVKDLIRTTPGAILGKAVKGLAPAELDAALSQADGLMQAAHAAGTPLTLPEAMQQVTNGATNLGNLQRVIEGSEAAAPIMKGFYAGRPATNEAAVSRALDSIAPSVNAPTEIAPRIQQAAEAELNAARQETNAFSKPAYDATANNPQAVVPKDVAAGLQSDPVFQQVLKDIHSDPIKYGDLSQLPDNSFRVLDQAKKYMDDLATKAQVGGERFAASNINESGSKLLDIMDAANPRYASARNIQAIRQKYVEEPLRRSPTGQLADTGKLEKQTGILFNPNPSANSHKQIGEAVKSVVKTDPQAALDLTRSYLEQTFNHSAKSLASGPNQYGGAKFVSEIAGNSQQSKNLEAAIRALPQGNKRYAGFKRLMTVLEAQGKRVPIGSNTSFNDLMIDSLKEGGIGKVGALAMSPGKVPFMINDWYQKLRMGKNTAEIAKIITSPDAVKQFTKLSRLNKSSPAAGRIAASLLLNARNQTEAQ